MKYETKMQETRHHYPTVTIISSVRPTRMLEHRVRNYKPRDKRNSETRPSECYEALAENHQDITNARASRLHCQTTKITQVPRPSKPRSQLLTSQTFVQNTTSLLVCVSPKQCRWHLFAATTPLLILAREWSTEQDRVHHYLGRRC